MGGIAYGNFSGDTEHNTKLSTALGLWPNGVVFAGNASIIAEYNMTPKVGLRLAGEYLPTTFGSSIQNGRGFSAGIAYRFGKQ